MPVAAAAPTGAAAAAAQAATDAAAAEDAPPTATEKAILTVKLDSFEASAKAKIIREVKALLGCNLVEAKTMVEKAPTVLKENVVKDVRAFHLTISNVQGCKEGQRDNGEAGSKDYFAIEYIDSNKKDPLSISSDPASNIQFFLKRQRVVLSPSTPKIRMLCYNLHQPKHRPTRIIITQAFFMCISKNHISSPAEGHPPFDQPLQSSHQQ